MGVDCGRLGGANGELPVAEIGDATKDCRGCWNAVETPVKVDPCAPADCVDVDGKWR